LSKIPNVQVSGIDRSSSFKFLDSVAEHMVWSKSSSNFAMGKTASDRRVESSGIPMISQERVAEKNRAQDVLFLKAVITAKTTESKAFPS
jgi:hypothetical protein